MKKCKWLDCQGNDFFPKQKGTPSLVKIEHKNTATLDSARSKKNLKSQFCNYLRTVRLVKLGSGSTQPEVKSAPESNRP